MFYFELFYDILNLIEKNITFSKTEGVIIMSNFIKSFFDTEKLIKPGTQLGELPTSKQAYLTMFDVAWPSVVESVLVSLISAVDTIMVGSLGSSAIAAVGITNQPKMIILALVMSLNIGVTAVVARRRGENNEEGANSCLKQSIMLCLIISILMGCLGFVFARPLLSFAGAKSDIIDIATIYFRVIMVGNVFQSLSTTINAVQRGCGNTKIAMKSNLLANIVNVIFNFLLINGIGFFPKLGTTGAAIATVLGNITAFILAARSITKKDTFLTIFHSSKWRFDRNTLKSIFAVSSSAVVEQVFMRIGFFTNTKLVAELGTTSLATYQICMNILSISFCFGDGFGVASSSLVGQSLGAKRPDKAYLFGKIGRRLALSVGLCLSVIFVTFRRQLIAMFTTENDIIAVGAIIMLLTAVITPIQTTGVVTNGCLRGAGDVKYVACCSLISITILRPVSTWLFCYPLHFGVVGAWIGVGVDLLSRLIFSTIRFEKGSWTQIKL